MWVPTSLLGGARSTAGEIVMHLLNGVRTAMIVFFLLFLFRALLRNQWAAAIALRRRSSPGSVRSPAAGRSSTALSTAIYFSMFAVAVMRWGLTTLTVGVFVADLLLAVPATTNMAAWYAPEAFVTAIVPIVIACRGFYTSLSGRVFAADLLS